MQILLNLPETATLEIGPVTALSPGGGSEQTICNSVNMLPLTRRIPRPQSHYESEGSGE